MNIRTICALSLLFCLILSSQAKDGRIDRKALVKRNNPHVTELDSLSSLNLGNGRFAINLDCTGMQTFPEAYKNGLSLGTYSQWAWHSFPNTQAYSEDETLEDHPLPGHPHGVYSVQQGYSASERQQAASEWIRANPHRLHLGNVGFLGMTRDAVSEVNQTLDMWNGEMKSSFMYDGTPIYVKSVCSGDKDLFAASIRSKVMFPVAIRFPYPTGIHTDDASDWNSDSLHTTEIISIRAHKAIVKRRVDDSVYYAVISWKGKAELRLEGRNSLSLYPRSKRWSLSVLFTQNQSVRTQSFAYAKRSAKKMWNNYWKSSAVIDFSHCKDMRAPLLERRVVLSQYLMRSQEAQDYPPAETGMTYNSWYGKFHLEMVMWHSFHYAIWNMPDLLERQLAWYKTALPAARIIASRQGFSGVRWMKMTDPSAREAPSDIGSFIIWQQPHPIYMAELIYRDTKDEAFLNEYYDIVEQTADFMASFVTYDEQQDRYIIEGACAANESYNESSTVNPAFEMSYWYFGLQTAQKWNERMGKPRVAKWDEICQKLAPLSTSPDGIYLPAEKGPGIPDFVNMRAAEYIPAAPAGGYVNGQRPKVTTVSAPQARQSNRRDPFYVRATSSENLLAFGMLPENRLFDIEHMQKTLDRAAENWGWKGGSWSWNYPSLAMNATRLLRSDIAVKAITMDNRDDLLLPSGNNYRSETLRMYLPGNGGLLLAVGMMCAGWDGCEVKNPGFPNDGTWDVRWEGLKPMP